MYLIPILSIHETNNSETDTEIFSHRTLKTVRKYAIYLYIYYVIFILVSHWLISGKGFSMCVYDCGVIK